MQPLTFGRDYPVQLDARRGAPLRARRHPPLPGQLRYAAGGMRVTARETCIHTLPSMLTALRLPSFHKLWAEIAA
jgi:hypothetical protein